MIPPSSIITHTLLVLSSVTIAGAADGQIEIAGFPALPDGFSPRYYGEVPPNGMLARRQGGGACNSGYHNCLDLGDLGADSCCPEYTYCYFKPGNWSIGCCGFGANCDSTCPLAAVRFNLTTTSDINITPSQSSGSTQTVLLTSTTETLQACSSRPCAVSSHLCPSSLGGRCCPNEQTCAASGSCIAPVTTTSDLVPTRGCSGTPNAFSCTVGGGCCLTGQSCAYVEQTAAACAGTAANLTSADGGGLSQGAKAGIGAGIAIAAAIVIAGVTWFCIRRRRKNAPSRFGAEGAPGAVGAGGVGGWEGGMHDSPYTYQRGATPGLEGTVGSRSEVSGPVSQRIHPNGLAYGYDGPVAQAGPFTEEFARMPVIGEGAVPVKPHGPSDIQQPVEIAAGDYPSQQQPAGGRPVPARRASTRSAAAESALTRESQQSPGLYELQGSFGDPSPMSPEMVAAQSNQPGSPHSPHSPGEGNPGSISPQGDTLQSWHNLDLSNYNPNNYHYGS